MPILSSQISLDKGEGYPKAPHHPPSIRDLKKEVDRILKNHHRKMEAERKRYERRGN